jgi:hypothetical protein
MGVLDGYSTTTFIAAKAQIFYGVPLTYYACIYI